MISILIAKFWGVLGIPGRTYNEFMIFGMDGVSVHHAAEAEIKGYALRAMIHDLGVSDAAFL